MAPLIGDTGAEHEAMRTRVLEIVSDQPGVHFRALGRAAGMTSTGQLRHHIDVLLREERLVEIVEGRYRRYFIAGAHRPSMRRAMARFSRPMPRRIGRLLLSGPMSRTELRRTLGCADSTLGYHLDRMRKNGDIVRERRGNICLYALTDQEEVRAVIRHDWADLDKENEQELGLIASTPDGDRRGPSSQGPRSSDDRAGRSFPSTAHAFA